MCVKSLKERLSKDICDTCAERVLKSVEKYAPACVCERERERASENESESESESERERER